MSDIKLSVKVQRLVAHSGHEKSSLMLLPIVRILQMRHKDVTKEQAFRVTKSILL